MRTTSWKSEEPLDKCRAKAGGRSSWNYHLSSGPLNYLALWSLKWCSLNYHTMWSFKWSAYFRENYF